jgi:hypothetical protein
MSTPGGQVGKHEVEQLPEKTEESGTECSVSVHELHLKLCLATWLRLNLCLFHKI